MRYLNRHHSENCGSGGSDCEKTVSQKFKFFCVWIIPMFLWTSIIFLKIPIPLLREFIDENINKSLHFLMAPAFVWSVGGMFYGMKKGYLGKGGLFGSSE